MKQSMKVVWFTNTPSLAESYINNKPAGGGWIKSLEKAIQKKVMNIGMEEAITTKWLYFQRIMF